MYYSFSLTTKLLKNHTALQVKVTLRPPERSLEQNLTDKGTCEPVFVCVSTILVGASNVIDCSA